jgi:hypothetical protein
MQRLPIGVPKLMVSTVASGDTSPYVGSADVTMMASERTDRVEPALCVQAKHELRRPARHHFDGRAPVAGIGEGAHVGARCRCNLVMGDVGLGERLAQNPRVDENHVDAARPDSVAHECVLVPLRVERSDQNDRRPPLRCLVRRRSLLISVCSSL